MKDRPQQCFVQMVDCAAIGHHDFGHGLFVQKYLHLLQHAIRPVFFGLGCQIAELITHPTESRARLCAGIYSTPEPGNPLGLLQTALEATNEASALEEKLRNAVKAGVITTSDPLGKIDMGEHAGVLTAKEARQLRDLDAMVMELIAVDDFDSTELGSKTIKRAARTKKTTKKKLTTKKKTARRKA